MFTAQIRHTLQTCFAVLANGVACFLFCLHSLCICIFNFKAFYKLLLSFVIHMNAYVVRILSRYLAFLQ